MGKNNGGCASFQAKRAQKGPCLWITVVYIVLCSEVYTTAPERSRGLERWSEKICRPALVSVHFFPLFMSAIGQPRLFVTLPWSVLKARRRLCAAREEQLWQVTGSPTSIATRIAKLPVWRTHLKCARCLQLVGRHCGLGSPGRHFRDRKKST